MQKCVYNVKRNENRKRCRRNKRWGLSDRRYMQQVELGGHIELVTNQRRLHHLNVIYTYMTTSHRTATGATTPTPAGGVLECAFPNLFILCIVGYHGRRCEGKEHCELIIIEIEIYSQLQRIDILLVASPINVRGVPVVSRLPVVSVLLPASVLPVVSSEYKACSGVRVRTNERPRR